MFKQGSNFLWQLAMSKAQHKMKMEESDRLLALEKIEAEKERAREQAKLKESREYTERQEAKKKLSSYAEKGRKIVTGEEQEALSITGAPQLQTKDMMYDPIAQAFVEPPSSETDPKYKVGEFQNFKEGHTEVKKVFTGGDPTDMKNWKKVSSAPRYKPTTDVNVTANISTATRSKIEAGIMDVNDGLSRIDDVIANFKPEYQELGTRWGSGITAWKEKLGKPVSAKDRKQLSDYSTYRKEAVANLNLDINALSGAAVSPSEAKRLLKGLPNPGTGLIDGDSPTEFKSALVITKKRLLKVKMRLHWYRSQGMDDATIKSNINSGKAISLDGIDAIINNRAAQLERDLMGRFPDTPEKVIVEKVKQTLSEEFGME
jgi:hypothetical protein